VEPGNKEELALALREALENEWNYQIIAEYGKRFSWDAIANEYLELYKNIVSKNGMIN
jgi:glycosyltransferase involved in cell wall biosynthesis